MCVCVCVCVCFLFLYGFVLLNSKKARLFLPAPFPFKLVKFKLSLRKFSSPSPVNHTTAHTHRHSKSASKHPQCARGVQKMPTGEATRRPRTTTTSLWRSGSRPVVAGQGWCPRGSRSIAGGCDRFAKSTRGALVPMGIAYEFVALSAESKQPGCLGP